MAIDGRLSTAYAEDGDRQLEEEHAWATVPVTHGARGGGLQRFACAWCVG
jgi:hypothetical protein